MKNSKPLLQRPVKISSSVDSLILVDYKSQKLSVTNYDSPL